MPFTIYKPQPGNSGFITTLKLTVNLNSIPETNFPYIPDDTPPNVLEELLNEVAATAEFREVILFFKKDTGNWMERASIRIFNKEPYYDIPLIRLFSDANTIDVSEDFSLGIQVKIGNVLTSVDTVLVWGSAVEEKKNNGNEELAARIEALELALAGRLTGVSADTVLGRNTGTGVIELLPQTQFAKPADIDTAILNLIGGAPGALNTLDELAQALADDANFANTIITALASKISATGNQAIAGTLTATKLQSSNLWELEPRSGSVVLNGDNLVFAQFAATKWIDSQTSHANFPLQFGMISQFDSLMDTASANKYRVQEFVYSNRWWKRHEANTIWGIWYELGFLNKPQTFTEIQNFTGQINVNGAKVLGPRETGWTVGTGTPLKGAFAADTATLQQTAQRTLALEQALRNHGLINS